MPTAQHPSDVTRVLAVVERLAGRRIVSAAVRKPLKTARFPQACALSSAAFAATASTALRGVCLDLRPLTDIVDTAFLEQCRKPVRVHFGH